MKLKACYGDLMLEAALTSFTVYDAYRYFRAQS